MLEYGALPAPAPNTYSDDIGAANLENVVGNVQSECLHGGPLNETDMATVALLHYEQFHDLTPGTATITDLHMSSAGVLGWALSDLGGSEIQDVIGNREYAHESLCHVSGAASQAFQDQPAWVMTMSQITDDNLSGCVVLTHDGDRYFSHDDDYEVGHLVEPPICHAAYEFECMQVQMESSEGVSLSEGSPHVRLLEHEGSTSRIDASNDGNGHPMGQSDEDLGDVLEVPPPARRDG